MSSRGFTLVEVLMVMVVVAVGAIAITNMQGSLFTGQSTMKDLQVQTALLQECAEQVMATRQWTTDGYDDGVKTPTFQITSCGGISAMPGYSTPSAVITDPYTGAGCPAGGTCKTVAISIGSAAPVTVMVVNY